LVSIAPLFDARRKESSKLARTCFAFSPAIGQ
jgi:hypothetical protein